MESNSPHRYLTKRATKIDPAKIQECAVNLFDVSSVGNETTFLDDSLLNISYSLPNPRRLGVYGKLPSTAEVKEDERSISLAGSTTVTLNETVDSSSENSLDDTLLKCLRNTPTNYSSNNTIILNKTVGSSSENSLDDTLLNCLSDTANKFSQSSTINISSNECIVVSPVNITTNVSQDISITTDHENNNTLENTTYFTAKEDLTECSVLSWKSCKEELSGDEVRNMYSP